MKLFSILSIFTLTINLGYSEEFRANSPSWIGILISGGDGKKGEAFDNARKKMGELIQNRGIPEYNQFHFSSNPSYSNHPDVLLPNENNLLDLLLLTKSRISPKVGCFFYLNGHGREESNGWPGGVQIQNQYKPGMDESQFILHPKLLESIIDQSSCNGKQIVIMVSACFSGSFFNYPGFYGKNYKVMTSATSKTKSFGCGRQDIAPLWDICIEETLKKNSGSSLTWSSFGYKVGKCVRNKEKIERENGATVQSSNPLYRFESDQYDQFSFPFN